MRGQKQVQRDEAMLYDKIKDAGLIPEFSVAVDAGAHVGSWAVLMARDFQRVVAFEPGDESWEMLLENTLDYPNINCMKFAVMNKRVNVDVYAPFAGAKQRKIKKTLTGRQVKVDPNGEHRGMPIDDLNLTECGFMKIDVEGCEYFAIKGAEKTIKKYKPTLCVEMNRLGERFGFSDDKIKQKIEAMGYTLEMKVGVDHVYRHKDQK